MVSDSDSIDRGPQGPTADEMNAYMEQQRVAMIENYRQTTAMHIMLGLVVKADSDATAKELAKKAKRSADALCAELFGE